MSDIGQTVSGGMSPLTRIRKATTGLAVVAILGVAAELTYSKHWDSPVQLIPWGTLVVTAVALWFGVRATTRQRARIAQWLVGVAFLSSLFGVWEHIESNHNAGALDFRYATTWSTFSSSKQWWMAISGQVGPAPTLVPLSMLFACALVLITMIGRRAEAGA